MSVVIPTLTDPFYSIVVNLDGDDYGFNFKYSTREKRWYFDILNNEGVVLLSGIKVITCFPLGFYQQAYYNLPPGMLYAVSGTLDQSPPMIDELGVDRRVQLVYYSAAELEA